MNTKIKITTEEALRRLVDFIEAHDVQDELANDGDGYMDSWRSVAFQLLIDDAKAALQGDPSH